VDALGRGILLDRDQSISTVSELDNLIEANVGIRRFI
jgi:hypothetical protein